MPIDPTIPLGVRPPQFNPQNMMEWQNLVYRNKLAALDLQEAQKQVQEKNALRQALQRPGALGPNGMPNPQVMSQMVMTDPGLAKAYGDIAERQRAAEKQAVDITKGQEEIKDRRQERTTRTILPYMQEAQDVYTSALSKNPDQAVSEANAWWQNKVDDLEKDGTLDPEEANRLRKTAFEPHTFAYFVANHVPSKSVDGWDLYQDPEGGDLYRTGPTGQIQKKVMNGWVDTDTLPKGVAKLGSAAAAYASTELSPDALEAAGWKYLLFGQNISGLGRASAKQKAQVIEKSRQIGDKLGLSPAEQAMLPYNNKVKTKAMSNLTNWAAQVKPAMDRLHRSLDMAIEYASQMDPSDIRAMNRAVIAGKLELGSGIAAQYAQAMNTVSREYARLISGPTSNAMLPVEAMKQADNLVSTANSPEQLAGMKATMLREAEITNSAVQDQLLTLSQSLYNPNLAGSIEAGGGLPQPGGTPPAPGTVPQPVSSPVSTPSVPGDYSRLWK